MPEPAEVAVVERAQIGDPVFQHRDALDPHAEGESLVDRGIDVAVLQHLRVHHAGAEDLQPVATGADLQPSALARAADVDLGRGLREGEVARAEAYGQIIHLEEGAAELDEATLEVA